MNQTDLAWRMYDNLNWARWVGPNRVSPEPVDVGAELEAVWTAPDEVFVRQLHLLLIGRPIAPAKLADLCAVLEAGTPRAVAARAIALSPEACASRRSATCLARLETLHPNSVWDRIQTLWTEPDSVFVTGLYALLLVRPVDAGGLADYGAKLAAGMPRADVVRTLARSVEARRRKTDVAWLPRLRTLPGGRGRLFSLRILRVVLRRLAAVRPSALLARVRRGR